MVIGPSYAALRYGESNWKRIVWRCVDSRNVPTAFAPCALTQNGSSAGWL
ncbi:MAG: hypothetical protein WC683_14795 [bacterium]